MLDSTRTYLLGRSKCNSRAGKSKEESNNLHFSSRIKYNCCLDVVRDGSKKMKRRRLSQARKTSRENIPQREKRCSTFCRDLPNSTYLHNFQVNEEDSFSSRGKYLRNGIMNHNFRSTWFNIKKSPNL